jgi:hypothetical protein
MDGHLRAFAVFVGGLHEPKFTDCYCTKQPQFATELFSQQLTPISMAARTANGAKKYPESNCWWPSPTIHTFS